MYSVSALPPAIIKQRLVDQFNLIGGIPPLQIQQAAHGILEGRTRMRVGPPVIMVTLPIQIERQCVDLLIGQIGIPCVEQFIAGRFLGTGRRSLLKALLNGVQLQIL